MIGAAKWDSLPLKECQPPNGRAEVWCSSCGARDRLKLEGSSFVCSSPAVCARNLERPR